MEIKFTNNRKPRKLVAVIGAGGTGLYVQAAASSMEAKVYFIGPRGAENVVAETDLLEDFLNAPGYDRTAVYEGDEITIKF